MSGERQQNQNLTFLVQIIINMYSQIMAEQRVSTVVYKTRRFLNHDFDLVKTDAVMIHDAIPSDWNLLHFSVWEHLEREQNKGQPTSKEEL